MATKPKTKRNPKGIRRDEQFQRDKKKNESQEYIWVSNRRGRKVKRKNPNYKPPKTNKEKITVNKDTDTGGYYKIPGLKQPDFNEKKSQTSKTSKTSKPSEKDKKIGKDLVTQAKKDDADIAAAYNKKKSASSEKETGKELGKWVSDIPAPSKKKKKSEPKKSNVFTKHYKTGKELGVMTRSQRRKYDAEAHAAAQRKKKKNRNSLTVDK
tara:strand:+ start:401 stop:1030 length:630 start_codon:yes stop_codon:yes gene_type:complete